MIDPEALIEDAIIQTGRSEFGGMTWREGLDRWSDALNSEAALSPGGVLLVANQISQALANRLNVVAWHEAHPEASERRVDAPVFVIGLPRTGTTLLSNLLDLDPENRSLRRFEARASTPPPSKEIDQERALYAQEELDLLYLGNPDLKAIHYESAGSPTECIALLGQEFRSVHFELITHVPSYGDWLMSCDMVPAYRWHKSVLQLLQWSHCGRWCLKSYCHNLALPALLEVYPDARFVVTHRSPEEVVASQCSLASAMHKVASDSDRSVYRARRWLDLLHQMAERCLDLRNVVGEERLVQVSYLDLVAQPQATLARIYRRLDWRFEHGLAESIATYLARNPQRRFGAHSYRLEDFGLSKEEVRGRFARYCHECARLETRNPVH